MASVIKTIFVFILIYIVTVSSQKKDKTAKERARERRQDRRVEGDIVDTRAIQQSLFDAAHTKFTGINNGHYVYQFQRSCFCPICDIQSMNVKVEDNTVSTVEFAEGNDYAMTSFCFNNDELFSQRLIESELTITDIFTLIATAIANGENIAVIYHADIGIPLSISIDPIPNAVDDELFIAINCIQFNLDFPSPAANSRRNRRDRRNSVSMESFNSDNPYSCQNIQVPSECPTAFFACNRYSDGCNTCTCDESGAIISCTKRVCDDEDNAIIQQPVCLDCESNTEWASCGGHPQCIPDCSDSDNFCGLGAITECIAARCECPASRPRWDGTECITEIDCGLDGEDGNDIDTDINVVPFCVDHCNEYSNGCTSCPCDDTGFVSGECSIIHDEGEVIGCNSGSFELRQCLECQDDETMIYTQCGGPDVTCETLGTFPTITQCIEKCQCREEFPIYDPNLGKCVTADICDTTPPFVDAGNCVQHCPIYFNGCNACQCPGIVVDDSEDDGSDFCTNILCQDGVEGGPKRRCFRCEIDTMEYTQCGKCDRTCFNPSPACLSHAGCIEKCQCPKNLPIYHEGECIAVEDCPEIAANNDVFESPEDDGIDGGASNVALLGEKDDGAFHVATDGKYERRKWIQWEEDGMYVIVAIVCLIVGGMLLLWPCCVTCIRRMKRRNKIAMENNLNVDNDEEMDDDGDGEMAEDEMEDGEDFIDIIESDLVSDTEDIAEADNVALQYGPDGSIVSVYSQRRSRLP